MGYTRSLISFVILTFLVGLGSLMLSTDQARAGDVRLCDIIIEKVASPANNTPFNFSVTGGQNFDFTLMDPSDATKTIILTDGNLVTVTEEVPPGWILDVDDEECTGDLDKVFIRDAPNGLEFFCEDIATVTCTFFNEGPPTVPTLSQWGLIAMAGILGIIGFIMVIRRRKVTV